MQNEKVKEKLLNLPTQAGCYIWRDLNGDVLYVGKAVNLKSRVNSYFNNYERLDPKIRMMVDQIVDVDTYTVDSEVEALILETNLIKKYRPKYNKLMKDDKNYSYVMIDWENSYPSVKIVREQDDKKAEYYGPYPSRFPIFKVLRRLRKVYPYCEHLPHNINKPLQPPLVRGVTQSPLDKGDLGGLSYLPYNKELTELAKQNRNNPTASEKKLWYEILNDKEKILGYKFLRQKPVDNFILDFYCSKLLLGIEIDGDSHSDKEEYDLLRSESLEKKYELKIIRFSDVDVLNNIDNVYKEIIKEIELRQEEIAQTPSAPLIKGVTHELSLLDKGGRVGLSSKPCFDYHIQLCSGVCAGLVTKEEHRKNITGIRRFFQGKKLEMIDELKKGMVDYSKQMDYEKATVLRDRIKDLEYVTQRIRIDKDMDEHKLEQMKDELSKRALDELVEKLPFEKLDAAKPNFKIECFDISNIQGTNAVASMVVSVNGKPAKHLYRKFKIRSKSTPDDFEMMRETLTRRLKRYEQTPSTPLIKGVTQAQSPLDKGDFPSKSDHPLGEGGLKPDESFSVLPDLLIVDGGKGQLSAAFGILTEMNLKSLPLVGLAKREEEIFYIKNQEQVIVPTALDFAMVKLPRRSEALYLVQRIRDEAHRFGITFHRNLRSKSSIKSVLDDVKGVGKVVKKKLMDAFGSIEGIKNAKEEDLLTVVRNKSTVVNIRKKI